MDNTEQTNAKFVPDTATTDSLMAWFKNYDELVLQNDLDAMAACAHFPLTVITDDSAGNCVAQNWDADTFKQAMDLAAQGVDMSTLAISNDRKPTFLNENLAVVVTDSVVTAGDTSSTSRYVDIMVKQGGDWKFKSMMQSGWGDMLKQYFGA